MIPCDSKGLVGTFGMAQMGAPAAAIRAHEELFAYWTRLRQGGRLPTRRDIRPADLKRLLPTITLTEAVEGDYRIRLAGTGLYNVYGGEITGRRLDEIYAASAADYWRSELDLIVRERRPGVGAHSLAWRGSGHLSLVWLRLPLGGDDGRVQMILGYDAVVGMAQTASGIRAA